MKNIQSIKVLGMGCKTCHTQYENVKKAISNLNLDIKVEYITDIEKVMEYGVMSMPGIVINEEVVSTGKLLKPKDIIKLMEK
ncbi:thioredoxin family protein [Floccifex sp.]|uniref:thioredoxin family protein n=1 Tax=Floccifex sp. TaxID=2815810 RepID=UPI003F0F315F